jgi:hypothetical protein
MRRRHRRHLPSTAGTSIRNHPSFDSYAMMRIWIGVDSDHAIT